MKRRHLPSGMGVVLVSVWCPPPQPPSQFALCWVQSGPPEPQPGLPVLLLEACDWKQGGFQVSTDMWAQRTEGSAQHLPALIEGVIRFALIFSPLKRGEAERWKGLFTEEVSLHKMKGNFRDIYLPSYVVWLKALRAACFFHSAEGLRIENTADGF